MNTPMTPSPHEKRRLAEVFGEDSEQTSDDQPQGDEGGRDDEWWRAQRPPHHGG